MISTAQKIHVIFAIAVFLVSVLNILLFERSVLGFEPASLAGISLVYLTVLVGILIRSAHSEL
jgi:hypothetical protein